MSGFRADLQTKVAFAVPPGACDCHVHVYLDQGAYPMAPERKYTPPPASEADLTAHLRNLGIERVVIVQPTNYGTDNAATLQGVKHLGLSRARAVAVIGDAADLDELHKSGVRGVRMNLVFDKNIDYGAVAKQLQAMAQRIAGRRWHIQIMCPNLGTVTALKHTINTLSVPVVIDHFGSAMAANGTVQAGFADLTGVLKAGNCYVKISASYRSSKQPPDYPDMKALASALIAANPDRVVWGSDWPHPNGHDPSRKPTEVTPYLQINDGAILNQLPLWAPDAATRKKILADNPARLYDF